MHGKRKGPAMNSTRFWRRSKHIGSKTKKNKLAGCRWKFSGHRRDVRGKRLHDGPCGEVSFCFTGCPFFCG
jgi:hypothetical protein